MGVGTLAGSSIMLLTAAWGGSLLAGRCDLDEKVAPHAAGPTRLLLPWLCLADPRGLGFWVAPCLSPSRPTKDRACD